MGADHSLDTRQPANAVAVETGTAVLYQVKTALRPAATASPAGLSPCPALSRDCTRMVAHVQDQAFCARLRRAAQGRECGFGTGSTSLTWGGQVDLAADVAADEQSTEGAMLHFDTGP